MLQTPDDLFLENGCAVYSLAGEYKFETTVDLIDAAIAYCKANNHRKLLVNLTGLTGFPPPSTTQRFQFATRWATTAEGRVILAVVSPIELIDPDRIGVTIGTNRGLISQVFEDETEAFAWLSKARN